MTELQASLIGIGSLIVIGVVSYNKWQELKAKKSVDQAFSDTPEDALMGAEKARSEPILDEPAPGPQEAAAPTVAEDMPVAEAAPDEEGQPAPVAELPVDDVIDCLVPLSLQQAMTGDRLLPLLAALQRGDKPVQLIGQREEGNWETVTADPLYVSLVAGIQMVNRSGALDEVAYSDFVRRLQQAADEINADPDTPDMVDVVAAARSLHAFVSEFDAQLGVNLRAQGASWAVDDLKAALERQGFDAQPDGRMVMPDGEGGILFTLLTNVRPGEGSTALLTLLLDVPRITPERDGFGALVACARSLGTRLDARLVDDSGQPLSDATLADIAEQVKVFYQEMAAAEIPAGSKRALRLFS